MTAPVEVRQVSQVYAGQLVVSPGAITVTWPSIWFATDADPLDDHASLVELEAACEVSATRSTRGRMG